MKSITSHEQRPMVEEFDPMGGTGHLMLDKLLNTTELTNNLLTFARATLTPGSFVGFHVHTGESETYYILAGEGVYNDNGKEVPVKVGDVTFTPDGSGHGITNTGEDNLEFIALIIKD